MFEHTAFEIKYLVEQIEDSEKYNRNHGADGRFTTAPLAHLVVERDGTRTEGPKHPNTIAKREAEERARQEAAHQKLPKDVDPVILKGLMSHEGHQGYRIDTHYLDESKYVLLYRVGRTWREHEQHVRSKLAGARGAPITETRPILFNTPVAAYRGIVRLAARRGHTLTSA